LRVAFRRLSIIRDARLLVAEVKPGETYHLPGEYDPDAMLRRVAAVGTIDPAKWTRRET